MSAMLLRGAVGPARWPRSRLSLTARGLTTFPQINPKNGQVFNEYKEMTPDEVEAIVSRANAAFEEWRRVPVKERIRLVGAVAEPTRARAEEFADLMCKEMGKPTCQGKSEVLKCAHLVDWYVENGGRFLQDTECPPLPGFRRAFVTYQPLGTILSIMPWNFPAWQVFRMTIPTLMAGNAVLLKHAPNCFGTAALCEELMNSLPGVPKGLFSSLVIDVPQVGTVLEHDEVRGVALTGSEGAGRAIASKAGGLLKKAVVELGGSDPYLVLADADLDRAAEAVVTGRLVNTGQVCCAPKRAIVDKKVKAAFEQKVLEKVAQRRYGVDFGPLVHSKAKQDIAQQVLETQAAGAKLLVGGVDAPVPAGESAECFFAPTVLTDVKPGMFAFDSEIFGPVIAIVEADDEKHAIELANKSKFGLGGAVFTKDEAKGQHIAVQELDAGMCFVNDFVRSDPSLPFGGTKASGLGRECGEFGILEFTNVKTICIK